MSDHEDDRHDTDDGNEEHDGTGCGCGGGRGNGCGGGGCGSASGCADCDPDLFDEHKCRREGIARQAEYNATSGPDLSQAAQDYETARKAYRDKRVAVETEVKALREQVDDLIEKIECQIKDDDVVRCLRKAFRCVVRTLEACGHGGGCCSTGPCDYDGSCPQDESGEVDYNELVKKKSDYERRLSAEKACFDLLKGEPDALKTRLDAATAAVEAVKTALKAEEGVDLKKVLADALVAQRQIGLVWNGFDSVQAYVDCLCRALTCWTRASEAVSELTRCLAVEDCKKQTRKDYCTRLAASTADEVLLAYERMCSCADDGGSQDDDTDDIDDTDDTEGSDEDDGSGDGSGSDPVCGCSHGHGHRRSHHKHGHRHDDAGD